MVTPLLRELAGPFRLFFPFEEPWFLFERGARHMTTAWDRVCREAIQSGSAEELHAARDDYQAVLLAHLKILDGYLVLADRFPDEYPHGDLAERLTSIRDELQQHYDSLFPRWQTLDDLEAILLESASLPNEQLKELAKQYPPPQAWYDGANESPAARE